MEEMGTDEYPWVGELLHFLNNSSNQTVVDSPSSIIVRDQCNDSYMFVDTGNILLIYGYNTPAVGPLQNFLRGVSVLGGNVIKIVGCVRAYQGGQLLLLGEKVLEILLINGFFLRQTIRRLVPCSSDAQVTRQPQVIDSHQNTSGASWISRLGRSFGIQSPLESVPASDVDEENFKESSVFVQGLPTDSTEEDIAQLFGSIGVIKTDKKTGKQRIFIDKSTGGFSGEARVTYVSREDAHFAVKHFNGKRMNGEYLRVSMFVEASHVVIKEPIEEQSVSVSRLQAMSTDGARAFYVHMTRFPTDQRSAEEYLQVLRAAGCPGDICMGETEAGKFSGEVVIKVDTEAEKNTILNLNLSGVSEDIIFNEIGVRRFNKIARRFILEDLQELRCSGFGSCDNEDGESEKVEDGLESSSSLFSFPTLHPRLSCAQEEPKEGLVAIVGERDKSPEDQQEINTSSVEDQQKINNVLKGEGQSQQELEREDCGLGDCVAKEGSSPQPDSRRRYNYVLDMTSRYEESLKPRKTLH